MAIKLEVGKKYVTRSGEVVGPIRVTPYDIPLDGYFFDTDDSLADTLSTNEFYTSSGKADDGYEYDLISEYIEHHEPKEVGTLKEFNVKVGDVVACGDNFEIIHIIEYVDRNGAKSDKSGNSYLGDATPWRIISRHQPSPVVEEVVTTTVKKIVPGVYGKISVGFDGPDGELLIDLTQGLLSSDLSAAIATLTTIRDAM